jgi:hypothetical protein
MLCIVMLRCIMQCDTCAQASLLYAAAVIQHIQSAALVLCRCAPRVTSSIVQVCDAQSCVVLVDSGGAAESATLCFTQHCQHCTAMVSIACALFALRRHQQLQDQHALVLQELPSRLCICKHLSSGGHILGS